MRRTALTLIGAGCVALSGQIASAADIRARPAPVYKAAPAMVAAYDWTGFYIGGHVGYGWGDKDWTDVALDGPFTGTVRPQSFHTDGFLGGGQVGVNWQTGPWVLGAEFDMSWTGMDGSSTGPSFAGGAGESITVGTDIKWLATATGRVGYAWNNWLWYVKGGFAWAHEDFPRSAFVNTPITFPTLSDTRTGWTVGAGAEFGWTPNWSVKLEYNYLDFGSEQYTMVGTQPGVGTITVGTDIDQHIHLVKLGINYRFGDFGKGPVAGKGPVVSRY
jgi:outer membrane immunogenic protein